MERPEEGVQDKLIQNDMQRVLLVLSLLITSVAQVQSIHVKNPLMWTDAPAPTSFAWVTITIWLPPPCICFLEGLS